MWANTSTEMSSIKYVCYWTRGGKEGRRKRKKVDKCYILALVLIRPTLLPIVNRTRKQQTIEAQFNNTTQHSITTIQRERTVQDNGNDMFDRQSSGQTWGQMPSFHTEITRSLDRGMPRHQWSLWIEACSSSDYTSHVEKHHMYNHSMTVGFDVDISRGCGFHWVP